MDKNTYQSIPSADQVELVGAGNARARAGSETSSNKDRRHYRNSNKSKGSTSTTFSETRYRLKRQGQSKKSRSTVKRGAWVEGIQADVDVKKAYSNDIFGSCFSSTVFESPYFYGPLVVFISLIAGICVYRVNNGWPWTMCFYYAAQALVGDMYAVPGDDTDNSKTFTLGYFIYGEFLLAATFAVLFDSLIESSKDIQLSERLKVISQKYYNRKRYDPSSNTIGGSNHTESTITCIEMHNEADPFVFSIENLLVYIDWPTYRKKYIYVVTLILWILVGVMYGYFMEGWNFNMSLYYALGAISTAGVFPPKCIGGSDDYDCEMTAAQSTLAAIYIIIGVPLFEVTLIELVALLRVEQKMKAREKAAVEVDLNRPLTQEDWQYGLSYLENDANSVSSLRSDGHEDDEGNAEDGISFLPEQTQVYKYENAIDRPDHRMQLDAHVQGDDKTASTTTGNASDKIKTESFDNRTNRPGEISNHEQNKVLNNDRTDIKDDELYFIPPLRKVSSSLEEHVEKVSSKMKRSTNFRENSDSDSSSSSVSSYEGKEHRVKEVVDLGDFVVLELIRMQRISIDEFKFLKMKFQELDVEGKGEIEIPRRSNKRGGRKNKVQHVQGEFNNTTTHRGHHVANCDNDTNNGDYVRLNAYERASYNSISLPEDSESTVNNVLLPSHCVDSYGVYNSLENNNTRNNHHIIKDYAEEEEEFDAPPTADDYNDFILRGTGSNLDQESDSSSFRISEHYQEPSYNNSCELRYVGRTGSKIMFNLAQRDNSIDLRDTRVDDPVEGEYEL